ncbi:hypothetical protein STEG23_010325, partial [Scotinomys teguina]
MRAADSGSWERVRQLAAHGQPALSCGRDTGPLRTPEPGACELCKDAAGSREQQRAEAVPDAADGYGSQLEPKEDCSEVRAMPVMILRSHGACSLSSGMVLEHEKGASPVQSWDWDGPLVPAAPVGSWMSPYCDVPVTNLLLLPGRAIHTGRCFGVLLREEVAQLQEEVHLLRQMKEMLAKDLEESQGGKCSEVLSATELRVQLVQKEQELARAKEALQAMKADRKRLKGEKTDLVSQMQQLYATLESREEQLRDFIRNYEQHRKESEDAVKALAKEKDLLEREKWELRRQAKEATDHAAALRSQLDLKDNRMKELEAELAMAKQSLATLTKDVPKRHSLAMPGETVLNGNQEWVVQADLPLTAAIRQSQQTLYHSHPPHPADRQAVRVSPCHSRQPSVISDASAAEGDRSSTPSDINSPRHRTHSLCN